MRELEGVVAEYERLQAAAGALGTGAPRRTGRARGASRARLSRRRAPAPRAAARAGTGKRAARGANREAVLKALKDRRSGVGASELAKRAGVGRVSTYQILGHLEREGLVRRQRQASGPALYSLR
jgi:hypothetical protein